jgi:hypothetical protein
MVTGQTLPDMSASNLANIYQDHSTHLRYPMQLFLCIDEGNMCVIGSTIESAFETYKDEVDSYIDISDLTFYELKNPIKARLTLVIDGGS